MPKPLAKVETFTKVFNDLLENKKPRKAIAYDAGVSLGYIDQMLRRFPLFFGLTHKKEDDD